MKRPPSNDAAAARSLLNAAAVRERAREVFNAGLAGKLEHFTVHVDRLPVTADVVAEMIRVAYPNLAVPFHARWRHFVVDGVDLWQELSAMTPWPNPQARIRAAIDLAFISVLLDAGAGMKWRYLDQPTGTVAGRSEGLALASLRMFAAGRFSASPDDPLRVDAARLQQLEAADLVAGFQVTEGNPLVGLEGRLALLTSLGATLAEKPEIFARAEAPRPGALYDHLQAQAQGGEIPAAHILEVLLGELGPIWPGRITLAGVPLGDTWRHPAVKRRDATNGLVPFHKLSQWLAYSLIEPLQWGGVRVRELDGLTGLAEYRNGGLFVDSGVIALRDPTAAFVPNAVDAPLIVEWRALTVALLDEIAGLIRDRLGCDAAEFSLAQVLEGGTWTAGRRLAREMRSDGAPPIRVASDGTVF
jgi:hypothetical protein